MCPSKVTATPEGRRKFVAVVDCVITASFTLNWPRTLSAAKSPVAAVTNEVVTNKQLEMIKFLKRIKIIQFAKFLLAEFGKIRIQIFPNQKERLQTYNVKIIDP
jgi:hypothetical protein